MVCKKLRKIKEHDVMQFSRERAGTRSIVEMRAK